MVQSIFPLSDQITEMGAVRNPYITGKHKLFQSPIVFTPALSQADLTAIEATFTGYAAVTYSTCGPVYIDPAGGVSFDTTVAVFIDTGPAIPNNIYGGWIEDAAANLLVAWQISVPYVMSQALDTMNVNLLINRFGPRNVVVQINGVDQ
jgi:hypothetical protein